MGGEYGTCPKRYSPAGHLLEIPTVAQTGLYLNNARDARGPRGCLKQVLWEQLELYGNSPPRPGCVGYRQAHLITLDFSYVNRCGGIYLKGYGENLKRSWL